MQVHTDGVHVPMGSREGMHCGWQCTPSHLREISLDVGTQFSTRPEAALYIYTCLCLNTRRKRIRVNLRVYAQPFTRLRVTVYASLGLVYT